MRSPFSDQKPSDIFIQELGIGGIAAAAGGVSPQRRIGVGVTVDMNPVS